MDSNDKPFPVTPFEQRLIAQVQRELRKCEPHWPDSPTQRPPGPDIWPEERNETEHVRPSS